VPPPAPPGLSAHPRRRAAFPRHPHPKPDLDAPATAVGHGRPSRRAPSAARGGLRGRTQVRNTPTTQHRLHHTVSDTNSLYYARATAAAPRRRQRRRRRRQRRRSSRRCFAARAWQQPSLTTGTWTPLGCSHSWPERCRRSWRLSPSACVPSQLDLTSFAGPVRTVVSLWAVGFLTWSLPLYAQPRAVEVEAAWVLMAQRRWAEAEALLVPVASAPPHDCSLRSTAAAMLVACHAAADQNPVSTALRCWAPHLAI
jgi:hypothetical protein